MPSLSDRDRVNLEAILSSAQKNETYVEGIQTYEQFYVDEKTFDSVLMNFVVIGEAVAKLSYDFRKSHNDVQWSKIKAFRNFIAHNYFGVDAEEIWQLIRTHLPQLKNDIKRILD